VEKNVTHGQNYPSLRESIIDNQITARQEMVSQYQNWLKD